VPASVELGAARVWCSDRLGGVSRAPYEALNLGDHVGDDPAAVATNRALLAAALGVEPDAIVWLRQVHGARVVDVEGPCAEPPEADAAVTGRPGVVLAVVTADCAPVALACDGAVAVVHAGHRGLRAGVVEAAVGALRRSGRGSIRAFLGPCIRPARYEFGERDLDDLVAHFGPEVAACTEDGGPAFDIPAAVRIALARAGVDDLADSGVCTAASRAHYSFRRDGVTGRQATLVTMP
jgi:hypothetical protein